MWLSEHGPDRGEQPPEGQPEHLQEVKLWFGVLRMRNYNIENGVRFSNWREKRCVLAHTGEYLDLRRLGNGWGLSLDFLTFFAAVSDPAKGW